MSAPRQEPAADLPGVVFHAAVLRGRTAAPATGRLSPQAALLQPRQSWQILRLRCDSEWPEECRIYPTIVYSIVVARRACVS